LARLSDAELVVNMKALLEHLFPADEVGSSLDENVDKSDFTFAKAVGVADVEDSSLACSRINTS